MASDPRPHPDDVDEIQQAWTEQLPGAPVASIGVFSRVWRISKLMSEDRRRTMERLGMDVGTRDLLATLRRAGEPYRLRPSEIARRAGVTPAAVSQWVARCEAQGLVRRSRGDEQDGRVVTVALTADGLRAVERVVGDLLAHEDDLVSGLSAEEVDQLSALLRRLLASLGAPRVRTEN